MLSRDFRIPIKATENFKRQQPIMSVGVWIAYPHVCGRLAGGDATSYRSQHRWSWCAWTLPKSCSIPAPCCHSEPKDFLAAVGRKSCLGAKIHGLQNATPWEKWRIQTPRARVGLALQGVLGILSMGCLRMPNFGGDKFSNCWTWWSFEHRTSWCHPSRYGNWNPSLSMEVHMLQHMMPTWMNALPSKHVHQKLENHALSTDLPSSYPVPNGKG